MATRRRKKPPSKRARRPSRLRRALARPRPRISLAPHHIDVFALAVIAVGVLLAGVTYLHWSGGALGNAAVQAIRFLLGAIGYAVPAALVVAGVRIMVRDLLPERDDVRPVDDPGAARDAARGERSGRAGRAASRRRGRPLRTGAICLLAALTLALAAGTLGLGPGRVPDQLFWHPAAFKTRGGIVGQAELWVASHLLSDLGASILAVFLLIAGVILVTGATLGGIVRVTGHKVAGTSRALRRSTGDIATVIRRPATQAARMATANLGGAFGARTSDADDPGPGSLPAQPSEAATITDAEGVEGIVAAGHVESPAVPGLPALDDAVESSAVSGLPAPDDAVQSAQVPAGTGVGVGVPTAPPAIGEIRSTPADDRGRNGHGSDDELTPQGRYRASVTDDPDFEWQVPAAWFLTRSSGEAAKPDTAGQEQVASTLLETLGHFGVQARVIGRVTGPHITRYELRLAPGTKVAKVAQLKDDLAYALAATDIRILAPIPGKQAVGVEVPNARRRIVHLGDVFQEPPSEWSPLAVWLGKDIGGRPIGADLAKMPHLLVAGTTGAGKSACVNAMLSSILLRATPHEVRFVLVDPKQVELNHYEGIPHLLAPVITSPRMAANALQNLVKEMEQRYGSMSLARTRSLPELNRARERRGEAPLPYVLCVIDELADLMMVAPADVEDSIIRLAQKARAVGIHLVLATQSPRVDVITGMIKANVPSRIAFAVSSQTDSRVILDQNGAESLLGQGDMLFSPIGSAKLQRIQGAFIDEEQIAALTDRWRRQGEPEFNERLLEEVAGEDGANSTDEDAFDPDEDPMLEEAIALVAQMGTASTSMLQRRLRLGYTRAGRLIDMLERRGIISGYEGSKPRQVLIGEADVPRILSHLSESEGGASAAGARATAAQPPVTTPSPERGRASHPPGTTSSPERAQAPDSPSAATPTTDSYDPDWRAV